MDTFPYWKISKRQPFLRIKFLDNKKIFFALFYQKSKKYNKNDKARRFYFIEFLPKIFKEIKPEIDWEKYIFEWIVISKKFKIIVKKTKRKWKVELQLLSIYPN